MIFAVLLLSISKISLAITCSYGDSGQIRPNVPYYNFGTVLVQRDTPVGTALKSVTLNYGAPGRVLGCTTSWTETGKMTLFTTLSGINNVFNTNLNGVGIKLDTTYSTFNYTYYAAGNDYIGTASNITATLIKTSSGAVSGGSLTTGLFATQYVGESPGYHIDLGIGSSNIIPVACSITTPYLNFPIGDVLASSFGSSVGTVPAGAQNTQNLGLNCDYGANINVSLSGTQNPDVGITSVLALTNQGSADVAKGVGVQILYNGSPLILNNRIVLKTSSGGQETFPITARYYQTKTTVTTGKANASATLNLTYQ
ncbi:hypothetical protein BWZ29_04540 [Enterobacter cancerogenus]|nr:hypothetical protein BWZ29_04540 [Enterobacter cancerogenus]